MSLVQQLMNLFNEKSETIVCPTILGLWGWSCTLCSLMSAVPCLEETTEGRRQFEKFLDTLGCPYVFPILSWKLSCKDVQRILQNSSTLWVIVVEAFHRTSCLDMGSGSLTRCKLWARMSCISLISDGWTRKPRFKMGWIKSIIFWCIWFLSLSANRKSSR